MAKLIGRQKEFRSHLVSRRKSQIILVLDNFVSTTNVASVFRAAYAMGVDRVYLVGTTPNPPFGKDLSVISDGAETKLDIRTSVSSKELVGRYNSKGFVSVALGIYEETKAIDELELDSNTIVVLADQNKNLSKEMLKVCDYKATTRKFRKYTDAGIVTDLAILLYSIK